MNQPQFTDDGLIDVTLPEGDTMISLAEHDCHQDPEDGCAVCVEAYDGF